MFFKWNGKQAKGIYYFFRYEVYAAADFTYVYDDDFSALASVKRPGDKDRNTGKLWSNPFFTLAFGIYSRRKARALAAEYFEFADRVASKYYNPDTDCYIKNIGVDKSKRGQGILTKMIDELCGDMPVFLETHLESNVAIYKKLGFELVDESDFHGYTHYAMKRKGGSTL